MPKYKKEFKGTRKEENQVIRMMVLVVGFLVGIILALMAVMVIKWDNRSMEVVVIGLRGEDEKVYNIAPLSSNIDARKAVALSRAEEFVKSYHSISPLELEMQLQWGEQGFVRSFASTKVWNDFLKYVEKSQWKEFQDSGFKKFVNVLDAHIVQNTDNRIKVEFEAIVYDDTNYEISRNNGTAILEFGYTDKLPAYITEQSWNKTGLYFANYEYVGG